MKKIISMALILLVAISIVGNVYAASCKVTLSTPKTELSKGDKFDVDVTVSDIDSEKGVMALLATLEYDKDSLNLVEMKQQNNWAKPEYNEANGKFVMEKGDYVKNKETVLKITFEVKSESKADTKVTLKDISTSDATEDIKSENSSISLKVVGASSGGNGSGNGSGNSGNGSNNSGNNGSNNGSGNGSGTSNSNTNKNTSKNIISSTNNPGSLKGGSLPKAGTTSVVLSLILVLIVIALICYVRMRMLDKDRNGR